MKNVTAEIVKGNNHEMNLENAFREAKMNVQEIKSDEQQAEEDARSLGLELIEAQAAHERKEEAERQGKETSEKVAELTG